MNRIAKHFLPGMPKRGSWKIIEPGIGLILAIVVWCEHCDYGSQFDLTDVEEDETLLFYCANCTHEERITLEPKK